MNAIASCMKTIQGMSASKFNNDLRQLHNVLQDTTADPTKLHQLIQQARNHQQPVPRVDTPNPPAPRVPIPTPDNQRITRAMMQQLAVPNPNLGVPTPLAITYQSILSHPHRKKHRAPAHPPNKPSPSAPAMNTRARKAEQAKSTPLQLPTRAPADNPTSPSRPQK